MTFTHYLNESAFKAYKDGGCEEVQLWVAKDERTCKVYGAKHSKKYKVNKRPVLPLHANCRCTYIPVIDVNKVIKEQREKIKELQNSLEIPTIKYSNRELKEKTVQTIDEGMKEFFISINKAPDNIRGLILESANEVKYKVTNEINRAFKYSPSSDTIFINPEHHSFEDYEIKEALMHELGHRIDYKKINLHNNTELIEAIENTMKNINLRELQKAYDEIIEINDSMWLSDILSAISNNKLNNLLSMHSNEYWNKVNNRSSDIVANLIVIYQRNEKEIIEFINEFIPDVVRVFSKRVGV